MLVFFIGEMYLDCDGVIMRTKIEKKVYLHSGGITDSQWATAGNCDDDDGS